VILRVVVITVLLFLVVRAIRLLVGGIAEAVNPHQPRRPAQQAPVKLARDPVCGTHIPPASALSLTTGSTTHYFCSETCRAKFRKSA
jgi:YHS domain-containing protein